MVKSKRGCTWNLLWRRAHRPGAPLDAHVSLQANQHLRFFSYPDDRQRLIIIRFYTFLDREQRTDKI